MFFFFFYRLPILIRVEEHPNTHEFQECLLNKIITEMKICQKVVDDYFETKLKLKRPAHLIYHSFIKTARAFCVANTKSQELKIS